MAALERRGWKQKFVVSIDRERQFKGSYLMNLGLKVIKGLTAMVESLPADSDASECHERVQRLMGTSLAVFDFEQISALEETVNTIAPGGCVFEVIKGGEDAAELVEMLRGKVAVGSVPESLTLGLTIPTAEEQGCGSKKDATGTSDGGNGIGYLRSKGAGHTAAWAEAAPQIAASVGALDVAHRNSNFHFTAGGAMKHHKDWAYARWLICQSQKGSRLFFRLKRKGKPTLEVTP